MIGGEGYSFGQDKEWMGRLEGDLKELGTRSEGRHEAEQKAGKWFRMVEDGAEAYMWTIHDVVSSDAAKRHEMAAAAAASRTVDPNASGEGQGQRERRAGGMVVGSKD